MNLERILSYLTHHSEAIIQWLFFLILALSGLLIGRHLFSKKVQDDGLGLAGADLNTALQKILEQTTKLESVSLEKLNAAGVANVEGQVQALKDALAARETELNELRAKGGGAETTKAASDLEKRIKELEEKLAEYEILEDDIADLSLYKEENTRLRTELDKLKGGTGPAVADAGVPAAATTAAPPAAEAPAAPAASGDDILAEFTQAVEAEPTPAEAAPTATMQVPDTGNPMADFETAVKLEKALQEAGAPVAAAPSTSTSTSTASAPATAEEPKNNEADDLFAEFAQPQTASEDGESGLDTDKMMAEMAALVSMEPATGNALEESIDTEKMAAEATTFNKS